MVQSSENPKSIRQMKRAKLQTREGLGELGSAARRVLEALDKMENARDFAQLFRALRSLDEVRHELRSILESQ